MTVRLFALLLFTSIICGQDSARRIGAIDFFGYQGLDVNRVRSSLPIHEGDPFDASDPKAFETIKRIRETLKASTGKLPTDVNPVCCDSQGNWMIFIGLGGNSIRSTKYHDTPKGNVNLPSRIVNLYKEVMDLNSLAISQGRSMEDRSKGYALSSDEKLRAKQLEVRAFALGHQHLLSRVIHLSQDSEQRIVAAYAMGYARQSSSQIAALEWATRDADGTVRNNAIRALGVLAESGSKIANQIPAEPFIGMLNSGVWTDRNKGSYVVDQLSKSRSPKLLSLLRNQALDALIEMARWRSPGHAASARTILGRIAGIEEKRLQDMIAAGEVEQIISSLKKN